MKSSLARFVALVVAASSLTGCEKPHSNKATDSNTEHLQPVTEHAPAGVSSTGGEHHASHSAGSSSHATSSEKGHEGEGHHEHKHKIIVTSVVSKDIINTQRYVCQIRSRKHIEVKALENGYLESIPINEGQAVKQGDLLFKVLPSLYQAKLEAEIAEVQLAQIEYDNAERLFAKKIESQQAVALAKAKLAKAQAQMRLSEAELGFANIKAPFNGIVNRLLCQEGSLVSEGDVLTTLSDNSTMWVYFNVPEARYLEYINETKGKEDKVQIELYLADHSKFKEHGHIGAIEADFNNTTGNIAFRADFPNGDGLLRHGQTGKIHINRLLPHAIVIPQRSTFEILAKRFVFVVDDENVIHQREITLHSEQDDIFIIKDGLKVGEKIILEGMRQVRDGEKVEFEFRDPTEVLSQLKNKAE